MATAGSPEPSGRYPAIASVRHTVMMLLIQAALLAWGFHLQSQPGESVLPENRNAVPLYVSVIALEWGLVLAVRAGVRSRGIALWDLVGGRWKSWKQLAGDVAVCIPFLLIWEGSAWLMNRLLGPNNAKSIDTMLPRSAIEVLLWIAVSISAGICEEFVFRGYFQRQFTAYTNNIAAGVVLQGIVFGAGHAYQGLKQVVIIAVLGMLYGWFAAWRRNLRANMVAHAWTDIWSGWLSRALR